MRWRRKTPANERKGRWGAHRIEAGLLVGGWEFESWAKRTTSSEPLCPATRQSGMRFRPATNIFIFTPQFRPFARCFVRVFSSFLRQEPQRKREMHAFRCCRRQEHELACFSLLFPTRIPSYQLTSSNIHSGCKVSPKTPSKNSARPYRENEQTASCITDSSNQSKTQRGISISATSSAVHTVFSNGISCRFLTKRFIYWIPVTTYRTKSNFSVPRKFWKEHSMFIWINFPCCYFMQTNLYYA